MKKSILFVIPDYHCSFFYRVALRKRGWKADIFVSFAYPEKLLYSDKDISKSKYVFKTFRPIYNLILLINFLLNYKYFFMYGGNRIIQIMPSFVENLFGENFYFDLFIAKLLKKKLIYLPSGCLDVDTKENISKYDDGNICNNCGWGDNVCNDKKNIKKFNVLNKYFDGFLGFSDIESKQYNQTTYKYKSIDLNLWSPKIEIPEQFKLPKTDKLRILHSFFKENRENSGKNIKGSPSIIEAIKQLEKEGYNVEYFYVTDVLSKDMRFYQAQADIVVEQLIYGWWGSTGVETMALGKPVICYLREDAKKNFYKFFPEYDSLPIIEANVQNIYEVLKKTVEDKTFREEKARESRKFAESFFDIEKNVKEFEQILLELQ